MRIYIIRHADPDYKNNTITPDGHKEAKALAERMSIKGLDRIYSSPMGRAIDTMKYTADALDMDYKIEEWTRELSDLRLEGSPWGALAAWNIPGESVREGDRHPTHTDWHKHPILNKTISKEKFEELKRNSDDFLRGLGYKRIEGRYRCLNPNSEKNAVFCHGGFGLTWIAHLLEIPLPLMWTGFWLSPSSVTTILFEERSKNWAVPRCLGIGDTSHLYKAGLEVKPRGIVANYW